MSADVCISVYAQHHGSVWIDCNGMLVVCLRNIFLPPQVTDGFQNRGSVHSEWILIHVYHLIVGQQRECEFIETRQITPYQQRNGA